MLISLLYGRCGIVRILACFSFFSGGVARLYTVFIARLRSLIGDDLLSVLCYADCCMGAGSLARYQSVSQSV